MRRIDKTWTQAEDLKRRNAEVTKADRVEECDHNQTKQLSAITSYL